MYIYPKNIYSKDNPPFTKHEVQLYCFQHHIVPEALATIIEVFY